MKIKELLAKAEEQITSAQFATVDGALFKAQALATLALARIMHEFLKEMQAHEGRQKEYREAVPGEPELPPSSNGTIGG